MNAMTWSVDQLTKEPAKFRPAPAPSPTTARLMKAMVAYVAKNGRSTIDEVVEGLVQPKTSIQKAARELVNEGRLVRSLSGSAFVYSLPKVDVFQQRKESEEA